MLPGTIGPAIIAAGNPEPAPISAEGAELSLAIKAGGVRRAVAMVLLCIMSWAFMLKSFPYRFVAGELGPASSPPCGCCPSGLPGAGPANFS